jgi:hypothetical protein
VKLVREVFWTIIHGIPRSCNFASLPGVLCLLYGTVRVLPYCCQHVLRGGEQASHSPKQHLDSPSAFSYFLLTGIHSKSKRYGKCKLWLLHEYDVHGAVCFRCGQVLVLKQMNPLVYSALIIPLSRPPSDNSKIPKIFAQTNCILLPLFSYFLTTGIHSKSKRYGNCKLWLLYEM